MIVIIIFNFFVTILHELCLLYVIIEYDWISQNVICWGFGCKISDVVLGFSGRFRIICFFTSCRLFTLVCTIFCFDIFSWICCKIIIFEITYFKILFCSFILSSLFILIIYVFISICYYVSIINSFSLFITIFLFVIFMI